MTVSETGPKQQPQHRQQRHLPQSTGHQKDDKQGKQDKFQQPWSAGSGPVGHCGEGIAASKIPNGCQINDADQTTNRMRMECNRLTRDGDKMRGNGDSRDHCHNAIATRSCDATTIVNCGGQKWHIIAFNNAPVLQALLEEPSSWNENDNDWNGNNGGGGNDDDDDEPQTTSHLSTLVISPPTPESLPRPKRRSKGTKSIPPADYTCKLCGCGGHWMEDCKLFRPHTITLSNDRVSSLGHKCTDDAINNALPPPPNYLCRLCSIPGHWIDQCVRFTPRNGSAQTRRGGDARTAPPQPPLGYVCNLCGRPGHWIQQCGRFVRR